MADARRTLHAKFRLNRFILSPSGGEKSQILSFSDFGIAIWQQSVKVGHGCTTTNLPLSNGVKIVSVLQRLHGEIVRRISVVRERDTGFTIFIIMSIIIANCIDVISSYQAWFMPLVDKRVGGR